MNADPLAALLVREGVLPPSRVEEAQERQVLNGGTLDTALLELGLLDERKLLELLPRAYNLRAVERGELTGVERSVTSLFPRRLAEKHGVVPLDVSGRRLTVALAGPPDMALLDEIGFMLSVYVKPAVTIQLRVDCALAAMYGVPLAPRMEALLQRLGEAPPSLPSGPPADVWQARATHAKAAAPPTPPPVADDARIVRDGAGPWTVASSADGFVKDAPSAPKLEIADGGTIEASATAMKIAVADLESERDEKRRRERVMWTVDDAIAELALAESRDEMLDVVLRFAYRRLSTVAVFVMTRAKGGAAFVGWDVIDPHLARKDISQFALPVEGNHALAQVHEMLSPFLGPLKPDDPLVRLFGRRSRAVILLPILVGDRFIGVLYGDCGARSIPPSSLAELHMVVPRLGKGLGNLILRNKKALRAAAGEVEGPRLVVVGELVEQMQAPGEAFEDIEVAAQAPPRSLPTIDIDITEIAAELVVTAPDGISSDLGASSPRPQELARFEVPTPAPSLPTPPPVAQMPWADGKDDDEDVRLDANALADLDGPIAPSPNVSRVEMGLRDAPLGSEPVDDDEDLDDVIELGESDRKITTSPSFQLNLQSLDGDAVMPPPDAATSPPRDVEVSAVAPSPGSHARESLLVATHAGWLAHDDAFLDDSVGQIGTARHRPGEAAKKAAMAAVVAHGLRALPALARYFPGVLEVHPFGAMERRPEVDEMSDCVACLVKLGADLAAPILAAELAHDDRLHRWAAVWALSSLKVPGALPRLAQRVFDPEGSIAALALEVLDGYRADPAFEKVLAQVRDLVRRGDPFQRERAILAVGELKDREALPALVDLIGTRPREIADEARRALLEITKQDFGTAERRWRAWIADNEKVPRTRWLIEGLAAKDDEIRKSAQTELNRMTGQFLGYRWDAPRADREHALQAWNDWWQTQEREGQGKWP